MLKGTSAPETEEQTKFQSTPELGFEGAREAVASSRPGLRVRRGTQAGSSKPESCGRDAAPPRLLHAIRDPTLSLALLRGGRQPAMGRTVRKRPGALATRRRSRF